MTEKRTRVTFKTVARVAEQNIRWHQHCVRRRQVQSADYVHHLEYIDRLVSACRSSASEVIVCWTWTVHWLITERYNVLMNK